MTTFAGKTMFMTVFTAAKEIEKVGGQALPIVGDVRDGDSVSAAVTETVAQFGGIDLCVNNASAINLGSIEEAPLNRFDLMNGIQVRGTYAVSQACIPDMKGRENPHILTLSPPLRLDPDAGIASNCIPGSELSVDLWVDEPNPPGYQSSSIPTAGII